MMLRLTFLCFVLTTGMVSQAEECNKCRPGWVQFQGSCFAYAQTALTFGEAAAICAGHGARLAVPDTKEKNDFLKEFVKKNGGKSTWIGGADALHEGIWEWMDTHKPLLEAFSDWHAGEPNDTGNNEDCLELYEAHGYQWNDQACTSLNKYICEYRHGATY